MNKNILLLFSLLFQFLLVYSQPRMMKGIILNEKGEPISGAAIRTVKAPIATSISGADGGFSIKILDSKDSILITSIGYQSQQLSIAKDDLIKIILKAAEVNLAEVTVTALGFEAKKDKLGYATSKVSGEAVASSGEAGLVDALGGKASGVRVSRTSGDPGGASQILIRGQSTITRSTDPLVVVDGMPINSSARGESTGGVNKQSRLNDINPDDIASVQILKGASAAALWGTRAANGVIIITTKKGSGGKTTISFKSTLSLDRVSEFYDLQSNYGQGLNGVWAANQTRTWGDKIANRSGGADSVNSTGPAFEANNGKTYYTILGKKSQETFVKQNYDQVIGNGYFLDNTLNVSSGDSKANYFFSLSDLNQKGIIKGNNDYRRSTVRFNGFKQLNNWLSIKNNSNVVIINQNAMEQGINNNGFMIGLLRTSPDFDNSGYIGNYYPTAGGSFITGRQRSYRNYLGNSTNPGFNSPLWDLYQLINSSGVNRFIQSTELNAKIYSWLNLTVRGGMDYFTDKQIKYSPVSSTTFNLGSYTNDVYNENRYNADVILRAEKQLTKNIEGNILFGYNLSSINSNDLNATAANFIISNNGPINFNNMTPANTNTNNTLTESKTNAGYSSIGFGFDDQLFVNATGRIEAASTFGALADKSFFYPSADINWQFTKNKIFDKIPAISFGKIRASYGVVGVQPDPYKTSTTYVNGTIADGVGGSLNPNLYGTGTFVQSRSQGNPYLRPEQKKELDFGLDLRFFDNRLSTSLTYYQNKTTDALISIPQPPSSGFNAIYTNAGTIENKGIEFDLGYNLIRKKDLSLNIDLTWTKNKNTVLDLAQAGSISLGGSSGIPSMAMVGYSLGELTSIKMTRDSRGALLLDQNGFPIPDATNPSAPVGDPNPDWRGSWGFNIKYKKLFFKFLLEHSQGGAIADGTNAVLVDYGTGAEVGKESIYPTDLKIYSGAIIKANTPFRGNIGDFGGGPVALDQSWYTGPGGWFGNVGEQFIKDASWTRLREISFGYNFNLPVLKTRLGIQSIEFEVSERNLLLHSNVNGFDPDTNTGGSGSGRGVSYFSNPPTASTVLTLKVNF